LVIRIRKGIIMPSVKKTTVTEKGYGKPIISDEVRSHANDPFVLDQVAKAKEFLRKHPLPAHLIKK
jgi:hypothetical protein